MKVSVKEPDFCPITVVIDNKHDAVALYEAIKVVDSFRGSDLYRALLDQIYS